MTAHIVIRYLRLTVKGRDLKIDKRLGPFRFRWTRNPGIKNSTIVFSIGKCAVSWQNWCGVISLWAYRIRKIG